MKRLYAVLAAVGLLSLTAVACAQSKPPAKTAEDRSSKCKSYAEAQFKAIQPANVSGTTFQYNYDGKTGFCTVDVENKTPGNHFASRMSTNVLDSSPTQVIFRQVEAPVQIVWKPAPTRLVCDEVKPQKDGKLLCTPTKQQDIDPFWPFPDLP
jgi:hypothetical protein